MKRVFTIALVIILSLYAMPTLAEIEYDHFPFTIDIDENWFFADHSEDIIVNEGKIFVEDGYASEFSEFAREAMNSYYLFNDFIVFAIEYTGDDSILYEINAGVKIDDTTEQIWDYSDYSPDILVDKKDPSCIECYVSNDMPYVGVRNENTDAITYITFTSGMAYSYGICGNYTNAQIPVEEEKLVAFAHSFLDRITRYYKEERPN